MGYGAGISRDARRDRAATPLPDDVTPTVLESTLQVVLRPLVRLLLRNGVAFKAFVESAKKVFVDVAQEDFAVPGRKTTISRTAVLTGLTRKDVSRLLALPGVDLSEKASSYNRATRVVTGWALDARFRDESGEPRRLLFDGDEPSFTDLVRAFSGDMPARAILDELLRVGAVSRARDGSITLEARAFVPQGDADETLYILGTDVSDLIRCIDHNLVETPGDAYFQRKVSYDNLVVESLPALKEQVGVTAQALLEQLNETMAPNDRDVNPDVDGSGRKRAMIGIYYYEEDSTGEPGT